MPKVTKSQPTEVSLGRRIKINECFKIYETNSKFVQPANISELGLSSGGGVSVEANTSCALILLNV